MNFPIEVKWKGKDWLIYKDCTSKCKQKASPAEHIELFNKFIAPALNKEGKK